MDENFKNLIFDKHFRNWKFVNNFKNEKLETISKVNNLKILSLILFESLPFFWLNHVFLSSSIILRFFSLKIFFGKNLVF